MRDKTEAPILACATLQKIYQSGDQQLEVLRGLDLAVREGEFIAITGESGSGKSTLLHLLGALDEPTSGEVHFEGREINRLSERQRDQLRNRSFGFVFQFHYLLAEFNALENAALPGMMAGLPERDLWLRAEELLNDLHLGERLHHRPAKLSGGEQQRVAVARAMINRPRVLFMDEPTGNLDPASSDELISLALRQKEKLNHAIVMVTHNHEIAARADRRFDLRDGELHPYE